MGRSSKATTARRNNLRVRKSETHQKPSVKDVSNNEDTGMDFVEDDLLADSEDDSEDSDDSEDDSEDD